MHKHILMSVFNRLLNTGMFHSHLARSLNDENLKQGSLFFSMLKYEDLLYTSQKVKPILRLRVFFGVIEPQSVYDHKFKVEETALITPETSIIPDLKDKQDLIKETGSNPYEFFYIDMRMMMIGNILHGYSN